jgi:hypothetical protein
MNSINLRTLSFLVLACTLSFSGLLYGQGHLVEFPYNPDSNGDDFVGTSDLLALLNLYGSEFSEEGLYVNEDSTAAIVHVGSLNYPKCAYQCKSLPGSWRVATLEDLGMIWDELLPNTNYHFWLGEREPGKLPIRIENGLTQTTYTSTLEQSNHCYCSTSERPKVEYAYCANSDISACVNSLVADGWYPLSGISSHSATLPPGSGWTPQQAIQAFWRWAE